MTRTNLLLILDGWGYRKDDQANALQQAQTPTWDSLWDESPRALLQCSGPDVGLPVGQMGNSEVGHMTIGAGRIIRQDLNRIDHAIETGSFAKNTAIQGLLQTNQSNSLHVFGLLSPGGVHSHESHVLFVTQLGLEANRKVVLHAFLDGRDTPPKSAEASLLQLQEIESRFPHFQLGSIAGRYYAMDRDRRWDRTAKAYELYVDGKSDFSAQNGVDALHNAYERGESDEFVTPTLIGQSPPVIDEDDVLFMNFRADRVLQLSRAFLSENDAAPFTRTRRVLNQFVALTPYANDVTSEKSHYARNTSVVFQSEPVLDTFAEVVSQNDKSQLRIAETEKFAHVTYFFSCGSELVQPNETRHFIPSPKVATYDQKPEMSVIEVTDFVVDAIRTSKFDTIICNFANADMVGHTGNFEAAVKAVECIDQCLTRIKQAIVETDSNCLITADHGNIEQMVDVENEQAHTAHTINPVPLVYIGNHANRLHPVGGLQDVAPTMLALMGIDAPASMTGKSLLQ